MPPIPPRDPKAPGHPPTGATGLPHIPNPVTGVEHAITQPIRDITDFLTNSQLWIRVGETAAGLILLFIGLKTLFPSQVNIVTSTAKKAAGLAAMVPK